MTDTTRYDPSEFAGAVMLQARDGEYVKHSDYAALLTRAEAAEAALTDRTAERNHAEDCTRVAVEALRAAEAGRDEALNQLDSARYEVDYIKRRCEEWSADYDKAADNYVERISELAAKLKAAEKDRDMAIENAMPYGGHELVKKSLTLAGLANCRAETAEAERDALQAKLALAVDALTALMDLNDNGGPFGGELYRDRVARAWDNARATLAKLTADTQPKEGKDKPHWFTPDETTGLCTHCGNAASFKFHYCGGRTEAEWGPIARASYESAADLPED